MVNIDNKRQVFALQHCDSEFLGLIEDHFEGRGIGFQYVRPFTTEGKVPGTAFNADGLILMGGGVWGAGGEAGAPRRLPGLEAEIRLTRDFLVRKKAIIAWGLGAQILALAAKGTVESHPLTFSVETVKRVSDEALGGYMPASYPLVTFMRDRPVPPPDARILAVDSAGRPACFQIGVNCLGFTGHPGIKPGIIEDLIMEFDDSPVDAAGHDIEIGPILTQLRALQKDIADALIPIMTGVIQLTGLMQPFSEAEMKRRAIIPIQR